MLITTQDYSKIINCTEETMRALAVRKFGDEYAVVFIQNVLIQLADNADGAAMVADILGTYKKEKTALSILQDIGEAITYSYDSYNVPADPELYAC